MNNNSEVEFLEWDTPFKNTRNGISGVVYVGSDADKTDRSRDLEVKIYDYDNNQNYLLTFVDISCFRVIDEHGLDELWRAGPRPARSTFKVKNHSWHKESPTSFFFGHHSEGEYSYMIATDWDCVEVVCKNEPKIEPI